MRRVFLALLVATPAFADEGFCKSWKWITTDDYSASGTSKSAAAVLVQRNATYVAGMSDDGTTGHWVVRKSTDHGVTWSVIDDYIHTSGKRNHPEGIAADGPGNIYVVGGANNLSMEGEWLVRKSANNGQTWSLANTFSDPTAAAATARNIHVDAQGAVLVAGESNVGTDGYHWFLRRSADQGQTWSNQDDLVGIWHGASAQAVTTNGGDTFVLGWNFDDGSNYRCQIRRQLGGAPGWTMVDDFQLATTGACLPRGLMVAKGHIFAAMQAVGADNVGHWIIRKSSNNGASWTTVDDLVMDGSCYPRGITWDRKLELFVTGKCAVGNSYKWITRRSNDLGATWTTDDVFQLTGGATTYANGIESDDKQNLVAVGFGHDGTRNHWIVRQRVCVHGHDDAAAARSEEQVRRAFKQGASSRAP